MTIIKLDAIGSTNDFLKELSNKQHLENFTVVTAENQTGGKGQMGSVWYSEKGKNLIMSVLIKDFILNSNQIFNINIVVSVAVIQALATLNVPYLSIKWPNDIMSDHFKIGGILIENSFKSDGSIYSIVGLGLNVSQTNFDHLPKASSLALVCAFDFDKPQLLLAIVENIRCNIKMWTSDSDLWSKYTQLLFKKNVPMNFEDNKHQKFIGIIKGVSADGRLKVAMQDGLEIDYNVKEIEMLY